MISGGVPLGAPTPFHDADLVARDELADGRHVGKPGVRACDSTASARTEPPSICGTAFGSASTPA